MLTDREAADIAALLAAADDRWQKTKQEDEGDDQ